MKAVIIFTMILPVLNAVYAQSDIQNNEVSENITEKKAVWTEITDNRGIKYAGWLWYADSSHIVLSEVPNNGDSLMQWTSNDVYKLKFIQKDKYGKKLLNHLIVTTGASALLT
jgi:hypothetical protein